MMSKKGLTLLEILISALILGAVMLGLMNIFVAAKRHVVLPRSRIQSAELARLFLAPLQMHVSQSTWNQAGNALNIGTTYCDDVVGHTQNPSCPPPPPAPDRLLNGITYTAQYDTGTAPGTIDLRSVKLKVSWNENAP